MASNAASAVYLIQLEDIDSPESKTGDLWLSDSGGLSSVSDITRSAGTTNFTLRCCRLKQPTGEPVTFAGSCLHCFSQVAEVYFHLLLAVTSEERRRVRLNLFRGKQGLLKWAAELSPGCRVGVRVKNAESGQFELLRGVVRHAGCLRPDTAGRQFGVELDPEFEDKGTSDGVFRKHRYFECKRDCAVFVSVDKLEDLRSPALDHGDSSYFSDQPTVGSLSGRLLRRSVAEMVQNCPLAVNDRVVWMSDNGPEYGTVRWIGVLPDAPPPRNEHDLTVGVEFDNPVGSGTGRYRSQTLFTARRRHASLVPIMGLIKETDFVGCPPSCQLPAVVCADSETTPAEMPRNTHGVSAVGVDVHPLPDVLKQNETGAPPERQLGVRLIQLDPGTTLSSVDVKGCVQPPSVADADVLCGVRRGIQAYSDTCVLEAIVFALFAYYSDFDKQLFAKPADNLDGQVKTILVEQIVNPLRATYFVGRDKMRQFGKLLTMIQSAKLLHCATSNVVLSDDPSGSVTTVLCHLLQVEPLIALSDSCCCVYDVDVTSRTSYPFPSLQHMMECSVVRNPDRRLSELPQPVFIVSVDAVRFGKLVTCGRIFPGLDLDISAVMQFTVHSCRQCGRQGSCVCGSCFTAENVRERTDAYKLSDYVFCRECFDENHKPVNRQDHEKLPVAAAAADNSEAGKPQSERSMFELFAIVSVVNGRHVSFVKVGSAWLVYDGAAAVGRAGNGDDVLLPEIRRCEEVETWLRDIPAAQRADTLPDVIVQLTSGLRLCFYRPKRS